MQLHEVCWNPQAKLVTNQTLFCFCHKLTWFYWLHFFYTLQTFWNIILIYWIFQTVFIFFYTGFADKRNIPPRSQISPPPQFLVFFCWPSLADKDLPHSAYVCSCTSINQQRRSPLAHKGIRPCNEDKDAPLCAFGDLFVSLYTGYSIIRDGPH